MPSRNLSATLSNLVSVTGNGNVVFSGSPTIDSPIITTNVGLPTGNTAARPATPSAGNLRFNNELTSFEGYNGTKWGSIGGGLAPTAIKTDDGYVAVANDLVRCNTAAGAFSVSFSATPSDGDVIGIVDVAGTFNTHNLTLLPNGATIEGDATSILLDMDGTYVSFIYNSSTSNWKLLETPLGSGLYLTPTPVITSSYDAVVNDIVRCNTTDGAFSVTFPTTPTDGSLIVISDIMGTFNTHTLTVNRGGTNTIEGDTSVILDVDGSYVTFMYNSSTSNWKLLQTPIGTGSTPTSVITSSYTASINDVVRCNTAGGAFAISFPEMPNDGSIVEVLDVAGTFYTNNLTINVSGSDTIEGDTSFVLDMNGTYASFMYNQSTLNWRLLQTPLGQLGGNVTANTSVTGMVKISGTVLANAVAGVDYMAAVTPGANNNILTSNGTSWVSTTSTAASTGKAIAMSIVFGG
jgi:hypothetical protein